jgi:hypothetical protein
MVKSVIMLSWASACADITQINSEIQLLHEAIPQATPHPNDILGTVHFNLFHISG